MNNPLEVGLFEIKRYVGRCGLCKTTTPTQEVKIFTEFVLPEGWLRMKYDKHYDYYVGTDYQLLCPKCVVRAKEKGYMPL
jgi:hypothetical protein